MTSKEFAKKIGVSRTTLSRVINNRQGVSEQIKNYIEENIIRYNFVPNIAAQNLVGKKAQTIGFFFKSSSLDIKEPEIGNHFFTSLIHNVALIAKLNTYSVLVFLVNDTEDYIQMEKYFKSGTISGAILLGFSQHDENLQKMLTKEYKLLLINQKETLDNNKNCILLNFKDKSNVEHIIDKFFKHSLINILFVNGDEHRLTFNMRRKGVIEAYEKNKTSQSNLTIVSDIMTTDASYNKMKDLLENGKRFQAVFAGNDLIAIGIIKALKEKNIRIPQEVSVVGYDDIEVSKYLSPALSTIKIDTMNVAKRAIETIINLIDEKHIDNFLEIEGSYIKRETTLF